MNTLVRALVGALLLSCLPALSLVGLTLPASADPDSRAGTVAEKPRLAGIHAADGEVRTVAQVGASVVLGGSFTRVGPATRGAAGLVDTGAGTFLSTFPDVVGSVAAAVPDGAGGWYLGGTFTSVGGAARSNVAQVDASGVVTSFDPSPNGPVLDLATTADGGLLVGGGFTAISGGPAAGLASYDAAQAIVWRGNVTGGAVRTVAVSLDGTRAYVGGDFSQIGGVLTRRLGAVNASSGTLDAAFAPGVVNLPVNDMVVKPDGQLLLVGEFTRVNGITRNRIAQVDGATGALGSLNVSVNNVVSDVELDAASDTAYLAGSFGTVGGVSRARVAGVSLAGTGSVTSLNLTAITGNAAAVTLDGAGGLYLGGSFQITPERDNPAVLARVAIGTGTVTQVVPYYETPRSLARPPVGPASGALVLVRQGSSLLVAGDFSDYGTVARHGLAAYDVGTGALQPFDPAPNGQINTVKSAAGGQAVFVGGEFTSIAGEAHSRIAKLDIATGQNVPGFTAGADSFVKDMQVRTDGQTVYVGGNFSFFNGEPASRLVAIDAHSGALLAGFSMPLTQPTNDMSEGGLRAMALSPDETRLVVIGNFRQIAGLERPLMAQIDVSGPVAIVTEWRTDLYDQPCARSGKVGFMRDVDISPDGSTAYVVTAGHFYYPACDSLNSFPMAPGDNVQPTWTKKIGDTMEAVAADRDTVYISGHFRYLETETRTQPRFQIAAVDPQTGEGLNWDPNAGGFRGVLSLELEPAGLFATSDGDAFGVVKHGRNAFWPNPAPGVEVRKEPSRPWVLAPSGSVTHKVRVQNTFTGQSVTLTGLSDQRMGNLAGSGTCSLPQTLGPGELYSCTTAAETVSGAAATAVTSTVTATATAGATTVSDTDMSTVQLIASAPVFRLRAVVGPGVVSYPGQTVRFSVTMMNLDIARSATFTQLVSPAFGDVSAECGLPAVVGPNRILACHVDRFVTGSVGSKPSFSFTGTAVYDTGPLTSTSSQSVTINPPVGGTKLLAVVANPAALSGADADVTNRLDNSYAITYADDDTVQPSDVLDDYSFVVLYPSVLEARLLTRLRDLDRPVLLTHSRMLDEMGMTAAGANGFVSGTQVTFATSMHPLSTARSGTLTINSALRDIGYGTPAPSAVTISTVGAGQASEFAYPAGAAMATGTAPACRIFIGVNNPTRLNTAGWALFDRAAAYTSMQCGRNMLWTAVGNGQSTYGTGDGRQSVTVGLNTPWGVAIDGQDRVYVADAGTHAVRRIDPDGTVTTVAGTGISGSTGDGGPATAARLNAPVRLAFDAAGNLYIADSGNNKIRRVTPAGIISTVAGTGTAGSSGDGGPATSARLRTPYDVAFGPDGSMYIADRANHRIRRVSPTGTISTFAGTGTAGYNGDDIAATSARLSSPYGVDVDAAGNVYIADFDNERIRVVTSGSIRTFAGTGVATAEGDGGPAIEAGLHKPQYVMVAPNGDVCISESNNNRVRVVHEGTIDTLAGSGQFSFLGDGGFPLFSTWSRPSATAFDSRGNLWVVDRGNRRVRVINAS